MAIPAGQVERSEDTIQWDRGLFSFYVFSFCLSVFFVSVFFLFFFLCSFFFVLFFLHSELQIITVHNLY